MIPWIEIGGAGEEEGEEDGATFAVNLYGIGVDGADAVRQKEIVVEEDKYMVARASSIITDL